MSKKSNQDRMLKRIWVCDSETDPFRKNRIPKPFLWGLYNPYSGEYHEFTDTDDFMQFAMDIDGIIYAHNGGKFDWHFILEYLPSFEPLTIIAGRLAKFQIGMAEFRDSYSILPTPLAAYQKDKINYDLFEQHEREKPENIKLIRDYMYHDCKYLGDLVLQFVKDYGISLTQAGAAMKFWQKLSDIKRPKSSAVYYENMKQYYYGGRVECFKMGEIKYPFEVIDIRSAYPKAMTRFHPWGTKYTTVETLEDTGKVDDDDFISRCFISLRARGLGAFPLRMQEGLFFPNDNEIHEFHISGWEYLAARDTGTLKDAEIFSVKFYYDKIDFTEYVDYFFEIKAQADTWLKNHDESHPEYGYWKGQRIIAKLFLNSLYGKFASNPAKYEEFQTIPTEFISIAHHEDGWNFCRHINERICIMNRPLHEEKRNYFDVAIAASITGYVRAYLWRTIQKCDGVLYCDTDSIAATNIDNADLGPELGQWEHEGFFDYGAIGGKKLYAFRKKNSHDYKIASKGVKLTPEQIIDIAKGETVVYEPENPSFSMKREITFTPRTIKRLDVAKKVYINGIG